MHTIVFFNQQGNSQIAINQNLAYLNILNVF